MGLASMQILVTAYYFVAVNEMSGNILFTINKHSRQIPIFIVMIAIAIGLNYLFIKTRGGIEGVAVATTIAYFLYFVFFFYYAFSHLMEKPELFRSILTTVGIYIYMTFLLHGIEWLCHLSNLLIECVVKFLAFVLFFSPILIYFEKREGVLKAVGDIICTKLKGVVRGFS